MSSVLAISADKWSYLNILKRKNLPDDRRHCLMFMDYARETEELLEMMGDELDFDPLDEPEPGLKCLSCNKSLAVGNLYCSEFCKDVAKFVRYVRACQAGGRILKIDIQEAIGTRILHMNGGGYPERARWLPARLRRAILERDGGKCLLCGNDATEIDHIKGSSDDPSNLRAICGPCSRKLAFDAARLPDTDGRAFIEALWRDLALRVVAPTATRVCDDSEEWKHRWPRLKAKARRARST